MKEGLVVLPDDVVILKGHSGDGKKPLPLSVIPDTEAKTINKAIEFVKDQQAQGNFHAGSFHSYAVFEGKRLDLVSYRVVLKK